MGDPTVPKSPSVPLPIPLVSPQGNNIMLVASQPVLQGPERRSYQIVFREVSCTWPPRPTLSNPPPCFGAWL